jgi:diguanylate cyclase (GGDEF)-like protein
MHDDSRRQAELQRGLWLVRLAGVIILFAGWIAVTTGEFGGASVLIQTIIFIALGAYAFAAAAWSRKVSVSMERKMRLGLLVHNMELENMAMRDDLTQLFNRRYFFERLERELQTARGFNRPLSVLLIDMDSLKELNDTYGHRTGDLALGAFGRFLLQQTRASDVPARIGGDEFAVILPDTNETQANIMVERLTKALEKTDLVDDENVSLQLGASLGLAGYPWSGEDSDTLVQKADAEMYAAKHARKQAAKQAAKREAVAAAAADGAKS